jgi:hypothetical protein
MRSARPGVGALVAIMVVCGWTAVAEAQVRSGEFSAGWKLLHAMDVVLDADETIPVGWYADVAGRIAGPISIVGEVAGAYKSFSSRITELGVPVDVDADVDIHSFLGGVRISAFQNPRVVPFGQVLLGAARGSITVTGTATVGGRQFDVSESESSTDLAIDFGGGVNLAVGDNFAVRLNGSFTRIGGSDDGGNAFRFGAGVVVPF